MNTAGLISALLLSAGFIYMWRNRDVDGAEKLFDREFYLAPDQTDLVDVTDAMTLVTARGVEIDISEGWDFEDVLCTLADIDQLGGWS